MSDDTVWCISGILPRDKAEALEYVVEIAADTVEMIPPTVTSFEVEDGKVWMTQMFFVGEPEPDLVAAVLAEAGLTNWAYDCVPVEDRDWVSESQRLLAPVREGRFFVYGSHDADKAPDDTVNLLIEAGQAFGTGQHETTSCCLALIDALGDEGYTPDRILDLGTGSGVLALAAHRVWADARVVASDIDPIAVEVLVENLAVNRAIERGIGEDRPGIAPLVADGLDAPAFAEEGPFDLVTANILAAPLIFLAPGIAGVTAKGGKVILSGILQTQADEVLAAYVAEGLTLEKKLERGDWAALQLVRN